MTTLRDLDELAHLLAGLDEDELTRTVAASLVTALEGLVGAGLGPAESDPLPVLLRRFARAHRSAVRLPDLPAGGAALLDSYRDALRDPATALLRTASSTRALQPAAAGSAR